MKLNLYILGFFYLSMLNANDYKLKYTAFPSDGTLISSYKSDYLKKNMINKIDRNKVNFILEVGAFDCKDSLMLSNYYKCPVIAFECSPESVQKCKLNIKDYPHITLVEKAVWEQSGTMNFNYCPNHPGSSSLFMFDYESMARINQNHPILSKISQLHKVYEMVSVEVEAIRLDEWLQENEIETIDLVCIDAQGATLPVLKSFGSYLDKVKYVIAEVEYRPGYKGEILFPKIHKFMKENGFICFNHSGSHPWFNNVIFIRKK